MPRPSRWGEIVQAAAEEFRTQGFDAAKIEDIAGRVGMLKGSLYNYIENKDDLLFAVIEEPAKQLLEDLSRLRAAVDEPATARLHRLIRAQVRVFVDHYPAAFVYLQQIGRPSHRADFREMDAQYMQAIEQMIDDGIASGEFSPSMDTRVAARAIVGMLDWMSTWFVPRADDENQEVADQLFAMAIGGLGAGGLVHAVATGRHASARAETVSGED